MDLYFCHTEDRGDEKGPSPEPIRPFSVRVQRWSNFQAYGHQLNTRMLHNYPVPWIAIPLRSIATSDRQVPGGIIKATFAFQRKHGPRDPPKTMVLHSYS